MSAAEGARSGTVWVSVEGVNGVGKTYLSTALAGRLAPSACLLSELTDTRTDSVGGQVISALSSGDSFLRTGHPLTETFALLALKVREYEHVLTLPDPPPLVLEDRGVDTVAMYQAAILLGPHASDDQVWRLAQDVLDTAATWRPPPDRTLLIVDDLDTCARRCTGRDGRPPSSDEWKLITRAERLYHRQAAHEPDRFRVVHRSGRDTEDVLDELQRHVRATSSELEVQR